MRVELAANAQAELAELEEGLSLPDDTRVLQRESLRTLEFFAYAGRALEGEWEPCEEFEELYGALPSDGEG